ncbi:PLD-like domain-containing protein [Bradyrhizobium brasilense]|uniref:Phospholipase D n=1 Tax=Bradyrhizobium brasilense TaxID=1419277 RepID=A0A1G7NKD3_9BRAD|nr:phospholipase D-like domain-containing protein [Bradyrhizobium brasilense]SDF74508.1 PLD-like domain-containing protein [Bradyrhizobium brasilense]
MPASQADLLRRWVLPSAGALFGIGIWWAIGSGLLGHADVRLTDTTALRHDTGEAGPSVRAGTVEIAFAPRPSDSALHLVLKVIDSAEATLLVAAYELSSKPVSDALINAAKRGVAVFVVADQKQNGSARGKLEELAAAGVQVRTDGLYPAMHNKFVVADQRTVETGSFNYSHSAQRRNAEKRRGAVGRA